MSILETAKFVVENDPNDSTRKVVKDLLSLVENGEEDALKTLTKMFTGRLQFGTAGLRAVMGAGYNAMNDMVILQTCQGLVATLLEYFPGARERGVVIGYDHRRTSDENPVQLSSRGFAEVSAAVFVSNGFRVHIMDDFVATPFVPFGIQHFKAVAGVMVTASHNPAADDGFKVYWANGAQIIPPVDGIIANHILENLTPTPEVVALLRSGKLWEHELLNVVTDEVSEKYVAAVSRLSVNHDDNSNMKLKVVYTAMHGIGCQWLKRVWNSFNFPDTLTLVDAQCSADPTFPTVRFPNPEEKGALDMSIELAKSISADIIIANDPDADRLAVSVRKPDGEFYNLTGNEIGQILGYWMIQQYKIKNAAAVAAGQTALPKPAVLASVVSSRMLGRIAEMEGVEYADTLTGFKWLGNRSREFTACGTPVVFMYEEALGYCVGEDLLVDKDGMSAAAVFVEMAHMLQNGWVEHGATSTGTPRTVLDLLRDMRSKYGEFVSLNSYVTSVDKAVTNRIFARIRGDASDATPESASSAGQYLSIAEINGVAIRKITDITTGFVSDGTDSGMHCTRDSHMIMLQFDNDVSVTLRTSGTEPKIKFYTEIAGTASTEELTTKLTNFVNQLVDHFLQPELNNLPRA